MLMNSLILAACELLFLSSFPQVDLFISALAAAAEVPLQFPETYPLADATATVSIVGAGDDGRTTYAVSLDQRECFVMHPFHIAS